MTQPARESSRILVVGSMAFDTIETPAGKADLIVGGAANHFSVAASFYAPVSLVAVVGDDFPQSHVRWLEGRGIDVSGLQVAPGKTFHWVGAYDQNLNEARTLATFLNVFEHFDPTLSNAQRQAQYLFLGNIDPVLQLSVLKQIERPALVGCDSMNFWITGKPEELRATLARVDLLSINEGEAYLLSGKKNLLAAAREIQRLGPKILVIKRGEYGALLITPHSRFLAPAYLLESVVDPTGAGDTFAGALMGTLARAGVTRSWLEERPAELDQCLRHAVLAGCVMASFTVEDFGTRRLASLSAAALTARQGELLAMTASPLTAHAGA